MVHAETITDMLEARVMQSPERMAYYALNPAGTWQGTTWKEIMDTVCTLAAGFRAQGVTRGCPVGIMARTCPTWDLLQFAALQCGGVIVGMDGHDLDENIDHIIEEAGVNTLVVQDTTLLDKLSATVRNRLQTVVSIERPRDTATGLLSLQELEDAGRARSLAATDRPAPADAATIIFTSGTTGRPKGILYRHEQVIQACRSILDAFPGVNEDRRVPCWLPLSNLFQRIINYCAIAIGASTYYVENPREIMTHLPVINPHVLLGVPRFFEKLHEEMMKRVQNSSILPRTLAKVALHIGEQHAAALRAHSRPSPITAVLYRLLDPLVLKRFRKALGSDLQYIISGSAPMPQWLLERFHGMGLLILEAYGISENVVPMAMNRPDDYRFGTVGKPLAGNDIHLQDDGEILVKGKGVFSGYLGQKNRETHLNADGYLKTGDLAVLDQDGYLSLRGRKSEVFKTSTGRKIAPVGIEDRIRKIDYVEHVMVMGAHRKALIALLSISAEALSRYLEGTGTEHALQNRIPRALHNTIRKDVQKQLAQLPAYQQPAGLILTLEPFSIEGGELTSNLKLRRANVHRNYKQSIDALYRLLEATSGTAIPGKALVYNP